MPWKKNSTLFLLKFLFSFILLYFILFKWTSLSEIAAVCGKADLKWLALAFSLHAAGLFISAVRWRILIQAHGEQVGLGFLAKSYLVGSFFNLFLPTRFGGDVVRIWDSSRRSKSMLRSSVVVIVERLTGVFALFLFAFLASIIRIDIAQRYPEVRIALIVSFLGLAATLFFFTSPAARLLSLIPEKNNWARLKSRLMEIRTTVLVYREKKGALLHALFWAALLQINVILHYYFVGKALHIPIPVIDYFIFIPVVLLILTIPITIGGLGLRESLYIRIFGMYGVFKSAAVSFSVIADIAFALIIGIIGGILYASRKN
jgi:uncharacterized protein (TIRG00374 family)